MVILELQTRDEMGAQMSEKLVVELMGRSSNIILVGPEGNITDCIRRADFGENAVRRLLPGMIYRLPPKQERPAFFACTGDERARLWRASNRQDSPENVDGHFSGLSSPLFPGTCHRCHGENNMPQAMEALYESVMAGEFTPYMLTKKDGAPKDYSFMAISQYGDEAQGETYPDFSSLMDAYYSRRDKAESMRRKSRDLAHSVRTARDRTGRKPEARRSELSRTADGEPAAGMPSL